MQVFDAEGSPRTTEAEGLSLHRARVFDALGEGLLLWDRQGRLVDCNQRAQGIFGRLPRRVPRHDVSPRSWRAVGMTADGRARIRDSDWTSRRRSAAGHEHRPVTGQVMGVDAPPDGGRVWFETDVWPVTDGDRRRPRGVGVSRHHPRKEADERMRALSAIVETSTDAIFRQSVDGTIDSWNAGAERSTASPPTR